jgi:hypothetical protein
MAAKQDLPADIDDRGIADRTRGFTLGPGETAEQFIAAREEVLRSAGIEPNWPGATEIRRKIQAGELGA